MSGFIKEPTPAADPWAAVESECHPCRTRAAHAGRLHVMVGEKVLCVAWRPLRAGERASDAWIDAARHRVRVVSTERAIVLGELVDAPRVAWPLEVPGAREAQYPEPAHMRFQLDTGLAIERQADALAPELRAYYARARRPVRRRIAVEFT